MGTEGGHQGQEVEKGEVDECRQGMGGHLHLRGKVKGICTSTIILFRGRPRRQDVIEHFDGDVVSNQGNNLILYLIFSVSALQ